MYVKKNTHPTGMHVQRLEWQNHLTKRQITQTCGTKTGATGFSLVVGSTNAGKIWEYHGVSPAELSNPGDSGSSPLESLLVIASYPGYCFFQ